MKSNQIVDAVRDLVCDAPRGNRCLAVLDKGFIFVGNISQPDNDGIYTLTYCKNVRKWGRNGLGGLCRGAKTAQATLDDSTPIMFHRSALIFSVPISNEWEDE